jgi:hypothetical protein
MRTIYPNGITVQELRQYLESVPDYDKNGEPTLVWIEVKAGLSSVATCIGPIDVTDVILSHIEV